MTSLSPTPREIAYRILIDVTRQQGSYLEHRLNDLPEALSARERSQIRYLTTTTIRRKLTLEAALSPFLKRGVEPDLWILLKLGAAQILFGTPEHRHADVNETVEVARRAGHPRWCKFLNGVLRNLDRACQSEPSAKFSVNSYPVQDQHELRALDRAVFPDPHQDWIGYLSAAFSLPKWLLNRWSRQFNNDQLTEIAAWFLSIPRMSLRVNLMKNSVEAMLARFSEQGIVARAGNLTSSILDVDCSSPIQLPGWYEGLISVQDETAQQAAVTLEPQPGETVWDMCAAPGTKTMHLAEWMQDEGSLVATDVNAERLRGVQENAERCGITCLTTQQISADGKTLPDGPFDAVLIDAPCSNTGVLGKRIEVRWRVTESDLQELSVVQQQLLEQASARLKPGGRILYSTCSIEPEENERVVEQFLSRHSNFESVSQRVFVPGSPADGGFQALLRVRDEL